jgi:hypothetical protein
VICTVGILVFLPTTIAVVLLGVLTVGFVVTAYRLKNYFLTGISGAFLFRIGFIIIDSAAGILPTPPIAPGHNQRAINLAISWSNGQIFEHLGGILSMRVLVAHLLAPFYVVLGYAPIAGRVGIAFISLFIGYLIFRIARHVTDRRTSVLAAAIVLFWPTIVYRSVVIQREIVMVVALLAVVWVAIQWLDSVTPVTVAIALFATASIFALRKENLLLVAVIVGFVSLVKSRDRPYYIAGVALLATPFFVYFVLNFGQFTGFGTALSPAAIDAFAYGRAHGDAVYLIGLHYETWLDIALYAPIKVLYFLFTPFPWHIQGLTELIVGGSALALIAATLCMRRGIARLWDSPYYLGLLLSYLVTGVLAYSIIEMNYGAAVRRRISFIPIILLLTVIGLSKVRIKVGDAGA